MVKVTPESSIARNWVSGDQNTFTSITRSTAYLFTASVVGERARMQMRFIGGICIHMKGVRGACDHLIKHAKCGYDLRSTERPLMHAQCPYAASLRSKASSGLSV